MTSPLSAIIHVEAADGTKDEYAFYFERELCHINWLEDLSVAGNSIEGFMPDQLEYTITYPVGTDTTELFSVTDIEWVKAEKHEAVHVSMDNTDIFIQVVAENGDTRVYVIYQRILLSGNTLLDDLAADGTTLQNFEPESFTYTYYLLEGQGVPDLSAIAQHEDAEVSILRANSVGDTAYVYVTAPNGEEGLYKVIFAPAPFNENLEPSEQDAVLSHIKGSNQFAAFTIRKNVQIALYGPNGELITMQDVPVCDPNQAYVGFDARETDIFYNVQDPTAGSIITLEQSQKIYFYVFFYDQKKPFKSGKISLTD